MGKMKKEEVVCLKIAGFIIQIRFILSADTLDYEKGFIEKVKNYYKPFLSENNSPKTNYTIEVTYEHSFRVIINKKNKDTYIHFYRQLTPKRIKTFYHLSGSQFQIIIRKITHELLVRAKGFILHASASKIDNKAVIFLGESGSGKSTTMKILSSKYPPLGDDSIIIKREERAYYCYSSSAHEKNAWFLKNYDKNNLGAVYFIRQSYLSRVFQITNEKRIIQLLAKQLFSEKEDVSKQMRNLINFIQKFNRFYYLEVSLNHKEELVKLVENV